MRIQPFENPTANRRAAAAAAFAVLSLTAAACGSDAAPAAVEEIVDEDASGSSSASASASASAPASEASSGPTDGDSGYEYASDVSAHRLVVLDVCAINELLPGDGPMDFEGAEGLYRDGLNSVNSDGSIRTIGGFASRDDRNPALQDYYGSSTPLDDFVTEALTGSGAFEGEADSVRRQGVQKGIQNQTMVAWVIHELNTALGKAADGNFDAAEGAPHNWDEAWAFYHGADGNCGPYSTGDKRAANYGTVASDGETAVANEAILAAMIEGRDALLAEDLAGAEASAAEIIRNVVIVYSQATVRYAALMTGDLAEGDSGTARVHQAEGFAFWRVIEAIVASEGADTDAINAILNLGNEPSAEAEPLVRAALAPAWDALGIDEASDIGELQ